MFEVEVATPEILSPRSVVVPNPSPAIVRAAIVEVVKLDTDDVARIRFPPIDLNVHGEFVDEPSVSASCGAVDDASVRVKRGEVVPIPTTAFTRFV